MSQSADDFSDEQECKVVVYVIKRVRSLMIYSQEIVEEVKECLRKEKR